MRRVALGLIWVATMLAALVAGPPVTAVATGIPGDLNPLLPAGYDLIVLAAFYLPISFGAAGAISGIFLRLSLSTRQQAFATRMALGETRQSVVRTELAAARRVGLWLIPSALLGGALARQAMAVAEARAYGVDGSESYAWEPNGWAVLTYGLVALVATGTLAVVVWSSVRGATRGAPAEPAPAVRSSAGSSVAPMRWWGWALLLVVVGSLGLLAFDRAVDVDTWAPQHLESAPWLIVATNIALPVASIAALWLTYAAALWVAELIVARVGARLAKRDSTGAVALAGDGLLRSTPAGRRVLGASVTIFLVFTGFVAAIGHTNAIEVASDTAEPHLYILSTPYTEEVVAEGWVRDELDPTGVAAAMADERMVAIPLAQLRLAPGVAEIWTDYSDAPVPTDIQRTLFAIDRDASGDLGAATRRLGLMDGVVLSGEAWSSGEASVRFDSGPQTVSSDGREQDAYGIWADLPQNHVDLAWAERTWGEGPVSALAVWAADDVSPSELRSFASEHFNGESVFVWEEPHHWGSVTLGLVWDAFGIGTTVFVFGVVAVLAVGLAVTSARLRRRELATMAALGAEPRALAAAPMLQAGIVVTAAATTGIAAGVIFAVMAVNPFLLNAGAPFDVGEIAWHVGADLAAVPWVAVVSVALATVAAAAGAGRVAGAAMSRRTPVEELRTADMEGVR